MAPYKAFSVLIGHTASINSLSFSQDGTRLASGADDGIVLVYDVDSGREVYKVDGLSPVTALLWSNGVGTDSLYAGFGDGRLLCTHVDAATDDPGPFYLPRSGGGVVEWISMDPHGDGRLAVCVGSDVEIWSHVGRHTMKKKSLPEPKKVSGANPRVPASVHALRPRSAFFLRLGSGLIVGFLEHGIYHWDFANATYSWRINTRVGRIALSPNEDLLAVSNLCDGFDLYQLSDQAHLRTFQVNTQINVPLPSLFIEDASALVMGSSCGEVKIMDVSAGLVLQELDHSGEIIQALAYSIASRTTRYIATGCSEQGEHTVIRVWRSRLSVSRSTHTQLDTAKSKVLKTTADLSAPSESRSGAAATPVSHNETLGRHTGLIPSVKILLGCATVLVLVSVATFFRPDKTWGQLLPSNDVSPAVLFDRASWMYEVNQVRRQVQASFISASLFAARFVDELLHWYIQYMEGRL